MEKTRRVTSVDVAGRAGVSRAIVSGVLNGAMSTMRVSDETRQRVLAAADELGYVPHPAARALRRRRTDVIGFVPRSSRTTPYEQPVPFVLGIHLGRAALARGYHVIEASTELTPARESDELVRFLLSRRVDGVVLDSPATAREVHRLVEHGLPVVQLIRPQTAVATPSIVVDAGPGIRAAVEHLVGLGHRRIGFVGRDDDHPVDRERLDRFLETLGRYGVPVFDGQVRLVPDYGIAEGYAATRELLAAAKRPSALFLAGDNLALGALQALYEAHVRIPDDMSLVSYDDIFAAHMSPPVTSVNQPLEMVARQAVDAIAAQLDATSHDGDAATIAGAVPGSLTIRSSTAAPAAGKEAATG